MMVAPVFPARAATRCQISSVMKHDLGELQIPVAVFIPGEVVERLGGEVEAIFLESGIDLGRGFIEARDDPAVSGVEFQLPSDATIFVFCIHEHVACCVP
jgi:hypothetical protein